MDEVATKIIDILKKHMKEPRDDIGLNTALTDLKIESLDLAMIVFDIEDTFGIEIPTTPTRKPPISRRSAPLSSACAVSSPDRVRRPLRLEQRLPEAPCASRRLQTRVHGSDDRVRRSTPRRRDGLWVS